MAMSRALQYELVEGWEQLPEGYRHLDVAGVAVDSRDSVYLMPRHDARVIVYERDGTFLCSWGEGLFTERAHGIRIGPDDTVYCVDDADHTVRKFTPNGQLLLTIGTSGIASDTGYDGENLESITHGGPPFNRPTGVAVAPNGDLYVSDGYGNARVHHFTADDRLIQSWGEPGIGPGQFNLPHDVWVAADGRVLVADRQNDRIQVFSPEGQFLEMWTDVQRPSALFVDREGLVYVAELAWRRGQRSAVHGIIENDLPGRVSVLDLTGKVITRLGDKTSDPFAPGSFYATHGICVDSRADLYVAEVTYSVASGAGLAHRARHTLQKFARK